MLVKEDGYALKYADRKIKADKEVVVEAIKQNGYALEFASDESKVDKEVVMAAVKKDGFALQFAGDELRGDKEVVVAAILSDARVYRLCGEKMQREHDLIDLANRGLELYTQCVDDNLCDELKSLKKKYSVDTLEVALEVEAADMESARLVSSDDVVRNNLSSVIKRV